MSSRKGPPITLPLYEERERELELCVYCPKLCRPACPVSNADPNESLIPWGKMSAAHHLARGYVQDASFSQTAWACTGCHACRDFCDHNNDVAGTLLDARREAFVAGTAPEAAVRVATQFAAHDDASVHAWSKLRDARLGREKAATDVDAPVLFLGCSALRRAPDEALAIHRIAEAVLPAFRVMPRCCGLPLLHAGDTSAFRAHGEELVAAMGNAREVVFADPGCHVALDAIFAANGAKSGVKTTSLVARAASELPRFRTGAAGGEEDMRYHDACHLGRGLGLYEEPRALLTRALGTAPLEFTHARGKAVCSGAGGGLPWSMPEVSAKMASTRVDENASLGEATIVTACPSSLVRFQKSGARARGLYEVLADALPTLPKAARK